MKRTILHFPFPLKNIVTEFAASLVEIPKQMHLKEATQFMATPLSPEEEEKNKRIQSSAHL
jgi:hypothetical protein